MKKSLILSVVFSLLLVSVVAAQVGINENGNSPDPSAMLDVTSTDKGVLVPRMTSSQRTIISNAAVGLLVFDLDTQTFWFNDANGWTELVSGNVSSLADADGDTKVQVEESPDEDVIKFDIGGVESFRLRLNANGVPLALLPNSSMNNTIYGKAAGLNVASLDNTILGAFAGTSTTTGGENTIIGSKAGASNTTAARNALVGYGAGNVNNGNGNSFLGAYTGGFMQTGSRNVLVGSFAGAYNVAGTDNVMLGAGAGENSEGGGNVFIGRFAGKNETSDNKLYIQNTDSSDPLIYGEFDNDLVRINGDLEVTGDYLGKSMLADTDGDTKIQVDDGSDNDEILFTVNGNEVGGIDSFARLDLIPPTFNNNGNLLIGGGNNGTGGGLNTFIGDAAALPHTSGNSNTAVGRSSMRFHLTGADNTCLGAFSLYDNENGRQNTAVGAAAGNHNLGSGNVFLGYFAGYNNVNGSNQLYIENTWSNTPLIYGEFNNDLIRINGDLEVTGNFPGSDDQVIDQFTLNGSVLQISLENDGQSPITVDLTTLVPVGTVQIWPTATPPAGWLICNGQSFSATTYPQLNAVLGVNVVPDIRDRFPLGAGPLNALGSLGGAERVALTSQNIPAHTHDVTIGFREGHENGQGQDYSDLGAPGSDHNASRSYETDSWGGATGNSSLTLPHENMPPYLTLNYIIKAK